MRLVAQVVAQLLVGGRGSPEPAEREASRWRWRCWGRSTSTALQRGQRDEEDAVRRRASASAEQPRRLQRQARLAAAAGADQGEQPAGRVAQARHDLRQQRPRGPQRAWPGRAGCSCAGATAPGGRPPSPEGGGRWPMGPSTSRVALADALVERRRLRGGSTPSSSASRRRQAAYCASAALRWPPRARARISCRWASSRRGSSSTCRRA